MVESKAFLACNEEINFDTIKRRVTMHLRSPNEITNQAKAIHAYIGILQEKFAYTQLPNTQAIALCQLLKKMTVADPSQRISAVEAAEQYENIFLK